MKNETGILVMAAGEVLWDELPSGRVCGGAAANFIFHAGRLGADARLFSAVGDDDDGTALLAELEAHGICTELVGRSHAPTGRVSVALRDGIPQYVIHQPAAWDHLTVTDAALAAARRTDAICFGTLAQRAPESRTAIHQLLNAATKARLRIFDVNFRQDFFNRDIVMESLRLCNVLKINSDELPVLTRLLELRESGPEDAVRRLIHDFRLSYCIVTRGGAGSQLFDADTQWEQPCGDGPVKDTVGCGDAFTAAWCVNMLRGASPSAALRGAAAVADRVAAHSGAMPMD